MKSKQFILVICMMLLTFGYTTAQDFEYIGAAKCKMCHNKEAKGKQYDVWKSGPHAKAYETLASEEAKKYSADPQNDAACLKCHSTYYSADTDLMYTIKADEGVSCESCHGPGSEYKAMAIMKSREKSMANGLILPEEAVCKKCHNEESPTFKGFNFAEYVAKITHDDPTTDN